MTHVLVVNTCSTITRKSSCPKIVFRTYFIMPFELAAATPIDIPEIVDVAIASFDSDPSFHQLKVNCRTADVVRFCIPRYEQYFKTPGVKYFKIVDTEKGLLIAVETGDSVLYEDDADS